MASVSIDIDRARRTAEHLEESACEIEFILHSMSGSVDQVLEHWRDPTRLEFEQLWQQEQEQLRDVITRLLGLASGLRGEADEFEAIASDFYTTVAHK